MAIRVCCRHVTHYRFDRPVSLSPHVLRLRPAPHSRTPIRAYALRITPKEHFLNWQQDPFGNYLARLVFPEQSLELKIEVEVVAEMTVINPFDFFIEESAQQWPFVYDPTLAKELIPYLETEPAGTRVRALIDECRVRGIRTVDYIVELNRRLHEKIRYVIRLE